MLPSGQQRGGWGKLFIALCLEVPRQGILLAGLAPPPYIQCIGSDSQTPASVLDHATQKVDSCDSFPQEQSFHALPFSGVRLSFLSFNGVGTRAVCLVLCGDGDAVNGDLLAMRRGLSCNINENLSQY